MPPSAAARAHACAVVFGAACVAQQDPAPLAIERELVLRGGPSHSLAWSPDGRWIASGGDRGEVLVVDASTGAVAHELAASDHWVGALRFAPDSRRLAVTGRDLTLWDLDTGRERARIPCSGPTGLAWSRDGRWIATPLDNDTVQVLHAEDLAPGTTLQVDDSTAIDAVAFSPDSARLAVGKRSGKTQVFALDAGTRVVHHEQPGWVQALAWLDGDRLLRLQWSPAALLGWSADTIALPRYAWGLAADPKGRLCLCWDGEQVQLLRPDVEPAVIAGGEPCAVHPDGSTWVRARDRHLEIHRGTSLTRRLPLTHRAQPRGLVLVGDGQHLAAGDGVDFTVFRLDDGSVLHWPGGAPHGTPVAYAAGPELVVWQSPQHSGGGSNGKLVFWSLGAVAAGRTQPVRVHALDASGFPSWGPALAFSADGAHVVLGSRVHDLMAAAPSSWELPFHPDQTVLPVNGGRWALSLRWNHRGLRGTAFELARVDAGERAATRLEAPRDCRTVAPAPAGDRLALLHSGGLCVYALDPWQQKISVAGDWESFVWLDERRVLARTSGGHVEIVPLDGTPPIGDLQLPEGSLGLVAAPGGRRAVVVRQDGRLTVLRVSPR